MDPKQQKVEQALIEFKKRMHAINEEHRIRMRAIDRQHKIFVWLLFGVVIAAIAAPFIIHWL